MNVQVMWKCAGLTLIFHSLIHHLNWRYILRSIDFDPIPCTYDIAKLYMLKADSWIIAFAPFVFVLKGNAHIRV